MGDVGVFFDDDGRKKVAEFIIFTGKLGPGGKYSRGKGYFVLCIGAADL